MDYSEREKKILNEMMRQVKTHEACIVRQSLQLAQKDMEINNLYKEIASLNGRTPLDPVQ